MKDEALKQKLGMEQRNRGSVGFQEALAQPEQPKVRTGDCLLVGVCASEGHKIQVKQEPWRESASDYERGVVDGRQMQAQSSVDKAVNRMAQPEPYDQTALELCNVCGWKTLIPDDACLNCERAQPEQEPATSDDFFRMIADRNPKPFSQPQRKPLTDGEIWDLHIKMSAALNCKLSDLIELTRAVEAAHGIKE